MNTVKDTMNAKKVSRRMALLGIGAGALLVSSIGMPSFARAQQTHATGKTIVEIASTTIGF